MTAATASADPAAVAAVHAGWVLARSQMPFRVSPLIAALQQSAFNAGSEDSARLMGLPVRYGMVFVDGWAYLGPLPMGPPGDDAGTIPAPPPPGDPLVALWQTRPWIAGLTQWPAMRERAIAENRAMQAIDPQLLVDDDLARFLGCLTAHHEEMIRVHSFMNGPVLLPLGTFAERVLAWTDAAESEIVGLCAGAAPSSQSDSPECRAAARDAGHLLDHDDALVVLQQIRSVASAAAFVDDITWRVTNGFDVFAPWVGERPDQVVARLRAARTATGQRIAVDPSALRSRVPAPHREEFDVLLAEARLGYGIRDERGLVTDTWSLGLLRRGIREAGRRLVAAGRLEDWTQLAFADPGDLGAIVLGEPHDLGELIDAARRYRTDGSEPPAQLGVAVLPLQDDEVVLPEDAAEVARPSGPVLPESIARLGRVSELAVRLVIGGASTSGRTDDGRVIRGTGVGGGIVDGIARVLVGVDELNRLEPGDVLVTATTNESFNSLVHLAAAIVTDFGGLASHPAILAREAGIPAVVGTGDATTRIPDGAPVRVDGSAGTIELC